MKKHHKFEKIMLGIVILLAVILQIDQTLAIDNHFYQHLPNAVSDPLTKVRGDSQYAMMKIQVNPSTQALLYNGTGISPVALPIQNYNYQNIDFDIASDGNYYWVFFNNSASDDYYTYQYNPNTATWNLEESINLPTNWVTRGLACTKSGSVQCYVASTNITSGFVQLKQVGVNFFSSQSNNNLGYLYGGYDAIYSFGGGSIKQFTGGLWTSYSSSYDVNKFSEVDINYKSHQAFDTPINYFYFYNQTANYMQYKFGVNGLSLTNTGFALKKDTKGIYAYGVSPNGIYRTEDFYDNTFTLDLATGSVILDIYFEMETNKGYAVSQSGQFYILNSSATSGTTTETPQEKAYAITPYVYSLTNLTNLNNLAPLSQAQTLASALYNGKISLMLFDHTNPNSPIITNKTLYVSNNNPLSLANNGIRALLGTGQNAHIFSDTDVGDAADFVIQNQSVRDGLVNDVLYASSPLGTDEALSCDTGTFSHYLIKYNLTTGTLTSIDPAVNCYDIAVSGDRAYLHLGSNGIKTYNTTTMTQIGSQLNIVTSTPSGIANDRLSIYGNQMAVVTGRNVIKIYDITTNTPVESWECRATQDITSLEMINDEIISIGAGNRLQICDKNNTALFDTQNGYYISKQLYITNSSMLDIASNGEMLFTASAQDKIILFQLIEGDLATINLAPIINEINVNRATPCINETIYGNIIATDLDTPQQLTLEYDCSNTDNYQITTTGDFFCQYSTSGSKLISVKATDLYSTTTALKSISVGSCIANVNSFIANLLVRDALTTESLSGALVNVIGFTSAETDNSGFVSFDLPSQNTFNISISKSGYTTLPTTLITGNIIQIAQLQPNYETINGTLTPRTLLTILVLNKTNQPIQDAIVSATDSLTTLSKTTYTDNVGKAYIYDLPSGVPIKLSAGKTGYQPTFTSTNIAINEQKIVTLTLLTLSEKGQQISTRGCQDYVEGLILCSPLNTSGDGDNCQQNSDCIGGRCQLGSGSQRVCSQYNYTSCDASGQERGGWCFTTQLTSAGGRWLSDTILDYFLYFVVFLIFIVLILIVAYGIKPKR